MLNRWLLLVLAAQLAVASRAENLAAAAVEVQLFPLTGDVRLANPNATTFDFVFYELTSPAGVFTGVPADWTSITDTYDSGSNSAFTSDSQWVEFSADANSVSEGLFSGAGHLAANRSIGLGAIWNPELVKPNDIEVTILGGDSLAVDAVKVISLLGDYNLDLVIDASDYTVWRDNFGSTAFPHADGNFNGVVDAADYMVWRDHFGDTLVGSGFGASTTSGGGLAAIAVPEPATTFLAFLAVVLMACGRTRRAHSV